MRADASATASVRNGVDGFFGVICQSEKTICKFFHFYFFLLPPRRQPPPSRHVPKATVSTSSAPPNKDLIIVRFTSIITMKRHCQVCSCGVPWPLINDICCHLSMACNNCLGRFSSSIVRNNNIYWQISDDEMYKRSGRRNANVKGNEVKMKTAAKVCPRFPAFIGKVYVIIAF